MDLDFAAVDNSFLNLSETALFDFYTALLWNDLDMPAAHTTINSDLVELNRSMQTNETHYKSSAELVNEIQCVWSLPVVGLKD